MALDIKPIIYAEEYHEDKPSIFRESENLDRLLQAIFDVCYQQQLDFLWLSQNLLNVDVAEKSHLDFIGNLVGQPRFLSDFNTEPYFGYEGSYQSKPFSSVTNPDIGGFWNSRSHFNTATARQLNDDEYRRLIKARAIYNQSNCTVNDLLEVINLLSNSRNNTVQMLKHGLIQINTDDSSGIISYFVERLYLEDNILPIAAGVRVGLEQVVGGGSGDDGDDGDSGDNEAKYSYINIPLSPPPNEYLLFNTYNGYLHKEGGVETILTISKSSTDWVLKDISGRGAILADAENPIGFISSEIEKRNSAETPDCWDLILNRTDGRTHSYSLGGNIEFVRIIADSNNKLTSGTGQLIVKELSNYISRYIFSAGECQLSTNFEILPHITNAESMFEGCSNYDVPVGYFNLSNIVNMKNMFKGNTRLNNGNLWNNPPDYVDCSSAENMDGMFDGCSSFAQDLSIWCVPKITSEPTNFGRGAPIIKHPVWGTCPEK